MRSSAQVDSLIVAALDSGRYRVHARGVVENLWIGREVRFSPNKAGYLKGWLRIDAEYFSVRLHRVIAIAFHGLARAPDMQVNHKDGDRTNNAASNLEWVTPSENCLHAYQSGLSTPHGATRDTRSDAKLSSSDVAMMCEMRARGVQRAELAERFGVSVKYVGDLTAGHWKRANEGVEIAPGYRLVRRAGLRAWYLQWQCGGAKKRLSLRTTDIAAATALATRQVGGKD